MGAFCFKVSLLAILVVAGAIPQDGAHRSSSPLQRLRFRSLAATTLGIPDEIKPVVYIQSCALPVNPVYQGGAARMMKASGFTFQQSDCAALEKGLDPKFVDAYKKQAVAAEPNEETIVAAMMLGESDPKNQVLAPQMNNIALLELDESTGIPVMKDWLWESSVIPLFFAKDVRKLGSRYQRAAVDIIKAVTIISAQTNVVFKLVETPKPGSTELAMKAQPESSQCGAIVGRPRGGQHIREVLVGPGCGFNGAMHEFLHALGFHHTAIRSDRDNYIKVEFDNISRAKHAQYWKYNQLAVQGPYNYQSVMHYRDTFFANKDPATGKRLKSFVPVETWKTTGKPKPEGDPNDPGQLLPSSGNGLMKSDAEAVNALYKPPTEAPPVSVANPTAAKW